MRRGYLRWIWKPQALIGFVVLCLFVGALSGAARSAAVIRPDRLFRPPHVHGASVERLSRPDCNVKPCLALTFDDGPNEVITPQILDTLGSREVKATFFVVGQEVAGREAILQREYREGHEIGNHSWNHPDLTGLTPGDAEAQIRATQLAIASAGVPMPRLLRPPYGAIDDMVAGHTRLTIVRWNIDPEDWKSKDPAKIHQKIVQDAKPGGIILLHDLEQATATALGPAIDSLKPYYQFVTVSQLLDLSPGDPGQYFGRHR